VKHFVILLGLVGCVNFMALAQEETEKERIETTWLSTGFNWGNYFDSGTDMGNFYSGSPGVTFNGYSFFDQKNIGFFFDCALMFPVVNTLESGYDPIIQSDFIIGVGFRHKINERFNLHFGIGPNFSMFYLFNEANNNVKSSDERHGWGIGGDIGLKYDLTDLVYIDFGTTVSCVFASYRIVESTEDNWKNTREDSNGWISNSFVGIKPYIAVGFNLFQKTTKVKLGKPKVE
jgi:hypothetical protein